MLSPITDVATTRSYGGLSSDATTGAATVQQIEAAILAGQQRMVKALTKAVYVTVRDYDAEALEEESASDKQEAFRKAESYFAMAFLPAILKSQQFAANGLADSVTLGQATTKFANAKETGDVGESWFRLAYEALEPYIEVTQTATDDAGDTEEIGVSSDDGSFSIMAI